VGTSSAKALPSPSWPLASPRREEDLLREEEEEGCDARRQAREHGYTRLPRSLHHNLFMRVHFENSCASLQLHYETQTLTAFFHYFYLGVSFHSLWSMVVIGYVWLYTHFIFQTLLDAFFPKLQAYGQGLKKL
jgi:hypothetical protein